jgi:hypothetical protein
MDISFRPSFAINGAHLQAWTTNYYSTTHRSFLLPFMIYLISWNNLFINSSVLEKVHEVFFHEDKASRFEQGINAIPSERSGTSREAILILLLTAVLSTSHVVRMNTKMPETMTALPTTLIKEGCFNLILRKVDSFFIRSVCGCQTSVSDSQYVAVIVQHFCTHCLWFYDLVTISRKAMKDLTLPDGTF